MLKELLNEINDFNENQVNHALSIILRANYEIKYMISKNTYKEFALKQMDYFVLNYSKDLLTIILFDKEYKTYNYNELTKLVQEIYEFFNKKYNINYDYKLIDPIYFSLFFYDLLDKLLYYKYDYINIDDFRLLRRNSNPVTLNESECYKSLIDDTRDKVFKLFNSNHIIDSDKDRIYNSLNNVRDNSYGKNNQYIVLYNNEPYIRDGQHRASSIKYLYGNVKVKVIRFYLKNNYFYE